MVQFSTTFSQILLSVSYLYSLSKLHYYTNRRYSLGIFNFLVGLLSTLLGVAKYGNPLLERKLYKADQKLIKLLRSLYPTLVATELNSLYWPDENQLQYCIPLIIFIITFMSGIWIYQSLLLPQERNENNLMTVLKGSSLPVAVAMSVSILNANFQGIVSSMLMAANTIFIGTSGYVFEVPVRDLYSYIQCSCNYHVIRALTD